MRDYSSQKNEIETIKPRTITVNLSDADDRVGGGFRRRPLTPPDMRFRIRRFS